MKKFISILFRPVLLLVLFIDEHVLMAYLLIVGLFVRVPKSYKKGEKGDVILIPGLYARWNFLRRIGDAFNKEGYRIHTIHELGNNIRSTRRGAKIVHEYIKKHKLQSAFIVSHSKGGNIAKELLTKYPETQKIISKVYALCTPFKGSWAAYTTLPFSYEMVPTSGLIKSQQNDIANEKFVNYIAEFDFHVIPNTSSKLEGAENIFMPLIGHNRLIYHKKMIRELIERSNSYNS